MTDVGPKTRTVQRERAKALRDVDNLSELNTPFSTS